MDKYMDFDQAGYLDYLRGLAQYQITQNPGVAQQFLLVHSQDSGQIYQSLLLNQPSSQYDDAMDSTDKPVVKERVRERSLGIEYIEDSDDEDEFDTDEDAYNYAAEISWKLFEEIIDECIAELGKPGVLLADESWRKEVCVNFVFPDVWLAMGGTL